LDTKELPAKPDVVAPDGADVRILPGVPGGSFAHFELAPGLTSIAVVHKTVDEVWYFIRGRGEMWRKAGEQESVVEVRRHVCITIRVGTAFQFRSLGEEPLSAVAATIPPWPGEGEATHVDGIWDPTVEAGQP
jgi:mannose-6-phosphate isomerase-like protein (cupin superfamily)